MIRPGFALSRVRVRVWQRMVRKYDEVTIESYWKYDWSPLS